MSDRDAARFDDRSDADAPAAPRPEASVPRPDPAAVAARASGYDTTALVLQGGGALGAYQAGVYEGLVEAGIRPDWLAGISIGALNAAIIAGNPPGRRVERLHEFWRTISRPPFWPRAPIDLVAQWGARLPADVVPLGGAWNAWRALTEGQNGFFLPNPAPPVWLSATTPARASFYDTRPLAATLARLVDFDRLNGGETRVSVGAVNVRSGNFRYFDTTTERLGVEHFLASGALPPGFPPVEIEGDWWWDGGLVSNTPLAQVFAAEPRRHALVFQVDLWSARGEVPRRLDDVVTRQKEIQYSSRTRLVTDALQREQQQRTLLRELMALVPEGARRGAAWERAVREADDRRFNVIHLIYRGAAAESHFKDYQFGLATTEAHWVSGLTDVRRTLSHPDWLAVPRAERPFATHDVHRR